MVEYWHSELGIELISGVVSVWHGQRKDALVVQGTAGNRPVYGPDASGYFRGRSVVQFAITGAKRMQSSTLAGGVLPTSGQRPYVITIARMRALDGASTGQTLYEFAGASSASILTRHVTNTFFKSWNPTAAAEVTGNNGGGQGPLTLTPHVLESWTDGANLHLRHDGTDATQATALALPADLTTVRFGRTATATDNIDANVFYTAIHSSKPTEAYIASVKAWANAYVGSPM